jgi:putative tryptophan/tyrosine transport system substrate-binding protein
MQRRKFITLLGGAAAAAPLPRVARAQQDGRVRRIAVLDGTPSTERGTVGQADLAAFRESLTKLGWIEGRNLRIDLRGGVLDLNGFRAAAAELIGLALDVIVTRSAAATRAMQQQTKSIPIIFSGVGGDPVATGIVGSIARPEGNTTGFTNSFNSISGKWMELLKEAAPRVARVALIFNPESSPNFARGGGYGAAIEAAAPVLGVQLINTPVRDAVELVRAVDAFAGEQNVGLLWVPSPVTFNRELLIRLAAQHRLPAIYDHRSWVTEGGLMSYGSNLADVYRSAASYVDRILRGAKVSDLPVQFPTKFELVVNLKTAKAIGLTIPEAFLLRVDELIE